MSFHLYKYYISNTYFLLQQTRPKLHSHNQPYPTKALTEHDSNNRVWLLHIQLIYASKLHIHKHNFLAEHQNLTALAIATFVIAAPLPIAQPWLQDKCGDISIPHPFGFGILSFEYSPKMPSPFPLFQ